MNLKLIIKPNRRGKQKTMVVWIKKQKILENDLLQLFNFFNEQVKISTIRRIHTYYKVTSENPAIMMSLFSTAGNLINENYFNYENFDLETEIENE